jgi:hypothetical protein
MQRTIAEITGYLANRQSHHQSGGAVALPKAVNGLKYYGGPWLHVKQAYLGLKFVIKGKTHFGWARVKLSVPKFSGPMTATLTGYAYETIPGKAIIAGATTRTRRCRTCRIPQHANSRTGHAWRVGASCAGLSTWRREGLVAGTPPAISGSLGLRWCATVPRLVVPGRC